MKIKSSPTILKVIKTASGLPYVLPNPGEAVAIGKNFPNDVVPTGEGWVASAWDYSNFGSYGGGQFVPLYSQQGAYVIAGTGGHNHPDNHGALIFNFSDATWSRLDNANGVARKNTPPYSYIESIDSNGSPWFEVSGSQVPLPPHPYGNMVYLPIGPKGSIVLATRHAVGAGAASSSVSHRFDLSTRMWSRFADDTKGFSNIESDSLYDALRNRIWIVSATLQNNKNVLYIDLNDKLWKATADATNWGDSALAGTKRTMIHDSFLIKNCGPQGLWIYDPDQPAVGWKQVNVSGTLPHTYNRWARYSNGNYYAFEGSAAGKTVVRIVPPSNPKTGQWVVDTITLTGAILPAKLHGTEHYTRLMYVPSIGCLAWIASCSDQVILFKPAA